MVRWCDSWGSVQVKSLFELKVYKVESYKVSSGCNKLHKHSILDELPLSNYFTIYQFLGVGISYHGTPTDGAIDPSEQFGYQKS